MAKFAIIIPCYNNEETVRETLDSAIAQTFDDYEIFISDSGSKDKSQDFIGSYSHPKLHAFLYDTSLPKAQNWNRAYKAGLGCEYLVTLHADDILTPDALQHLNRMSRKKPARAFLSAMSAAAGHSAACCF